jgi:Flp pilus assembly protein TadG
MSGRRHYQARSAAPLEQRGAALILVVVGMAAIIGIAGLALDPGHAMLNKTRLQNTVDAAALSAAKTLDETADVTLAEAAANVMFAANAGNAGNRELGQAYARGDVDVTVEFSSALNPFVAGSTPPAYVRVRAQGFSMPAWFSAIVGITSKSVAASAVAGPSPTINQACNIMPMMVCGDPRPVHPRGTRRTSRKSSSRARVTVAGRSGPAISAHPARRQPGRRRHTRSRPEATTAA